MAKTEHLKNIVVNDKKSLLDSFLNRLYVFGYASITKAVCENYKVDAQEIAAEFELQISEGVLCYTFTRSGTANAPDWTNMTSEDAERMNRERKRAESKFTSKNANG